MKTFNKKLKKHLTKQSWCGNIHAQSFGTWTREKEVMWMFISPYEYDSKKYRSPEMFEILRAYLLLKTGTPLSSTSIAADLNLLLKEDCFKTNDVTVMKYLNAMCGANEVIRICREYVKPHYNKTTSDRSIESGMLFYLNYDINDIRKMFSENCHFLRERMKKHPGSTCIQRQTAVAQVLYEKYRDELRSGALIHRYYKSSNEEGKLTIVADFLIKNGDATTIYLIGNTKSLIKVHENKDGKIKQQLIYDALKSIPDVKIKVVTVWDKEPAEDVYNAMINCLPGNCEIISWDAAISETYNNN